MWYVQKKDIVKKDIVQSPASSENLTSFFMYFLRMWSFND